MNIFEHFTSELDYKKKQDVSKCNFHFQMKCKFSKYCTSIIFISPRPTAGVVASTVESKGCPSDHLFQNPNLPQWCQINGRQGHAQQSKLARWRVTDMRTDIQYAFRNQAFQTKNKKHCILGGHHTLQSPPPRQAPGCLFSQSNVPYNGSWCVELSYWCNKTNNE